MKIKFPRGQREAKKALFLLKKKTDCFRRIPYLNRTEKLAGVKHLLSFSHLLINIKIRASRRCEKTFLVSNQLSNMKFFVLLLSLTLSFGFIELSHLNEEQPPYYVSTIEGRRQRGAHAKPRVKTDCIFE